MKEVYFDGFPKECIDFLWELRMNNNKEWFEQNRDRYKKYLKEPTDLFAAELNKRLMALDGFADTTGAVSRINRDVRFSKNKAPYKDRKWIVFRYGEGQWQAKPCYFFEICPEGYCFGMGFYEGEPTYMQAFRQVIDLNPAAAERVFKEIDELSEITLVGDFYKRKIKGERSPEIDNWYKRKNLALVSDSKMSQEMFSRDILDIVEEGFRKMLPAYKFLKGIWVDKASDLK